MITAAVAASTAQAVRDKRMNAWEMLEKAISTAMNDGRNMTGFKTRPGMEFCQNRKEVKAILEDLGYRVEYRKYHDNDYEYGNIYHIYW